MPYEKKAMTAFAQAVLAAGDLITQKFSDTRFSGAVTRVLSVEAPQMESTGGGKQARESIVLKAENGETSSGITAGFLDIGLRSCELRSFAALQMLHHQRYGGALDLVQAEYEKFVFELKQFLEGEGFVIKIIEPEDQKAKAAAAGNLPARTSGGGGGTAIMIGIGAAAALVLIALALVLVLK